MELGSEDVVEVGQPFDLDLDLGHMAHKRHTNPTKVLMFPEAPVLVSKFGFFFLSQLDSLTIESKYILCINMASAFISLVHVGSRTGRLWGSHLEGT